MLVDDATDESDLGLDGLGGGASSYVYEAHKNRAPAEAMLFRVHSADRTQGSRLPWSEASLRIEQELVHPRTGERQSLFLHNSGQRKARIADEIVLPLDAAANGAAAGGGGEGRGVDTTARSQVGPGKRREVLARSSRLVFSTVKSTQDTLKMMPGSASESRIVTHVKSMLVAADFYTANVSDSSRSIPEDLKPIVSVLLQIIEFSTKGDSRFPDVDWIKKANAMPPAAFSAIFDGENDPSVQRVVRDLKLIDAVFAMSQAAYARTFPKNPWPVNPTGLASATGGMHAVLRSPMLGPMGVQKLVHVVLQAMCARNPASQSYFGRATALVLCSKTGTSPLLGRSSCGTLPTLGGSGGENATLKEELWMNIIIAQLQDAMGPAVTLAKLLSSNEKLLTTYATPNLVLRFAEMIQLLGPQRRLVDFFAAICLVRDRAVKANQEMVLRLCWMRPEVRRTLFLELRPLSRQDAAASVQPLLKKYGQVRLPCGDTTDGKIDLSAPRPDNFLAMETYEQPGGFDPICVTWHGSKNWTRGVDELFFDAAALGLDSASVAKSVLASSSNGLGSRPRAHSDDIHEQEVVMRLEDLCWVLDPQLLCEAVTGEAWYVVEARLEDDTAYAALFEKRTQLASYFVGQLKLHTAMCASRSYNCIRCEGPGIPVH